MRRGHPGIGGWRNENPRHFRPRTGCSPRFRPPRMYSLLDTPRFPPPGQRSHRSHPYNTHSGHSDEHGVPEHHDGSNYRNQNLHQINPRQDRGHQQRPRQVSYPYNHSNMKQDNNIQSNPYKYYKDAPPSETFHINSLGDIDQRHLNSGSHAQDAYSSHRTHTNHWSNLPPDQRHYYEERNNQKFYKHDSERNTDGNKIPLEYTGHRPPSSDYYGSTSSATANNNNTAFSRSVDDTVDLVRRRLMNRNDPQRLSQDANVSQSNNEQDVTETVHPHQQQEQPAKKKRQRNAKSNCDKMKTNIVHQLFKMDKDKMHKLMDDPGSSSKFEYAISSLITESQNSLNRHLRSVAEKSLVSTSSDFIHNDNNTIYEDTFMKQMQCLLDPQDTVLLEDIKPLVLAELSKVLQIDDFDPKYDIDERNIGLPIESQHSYPHYENYNYEEYPQEGLYDVDQRNDANYQLHASADVTDNLAEIYNFETPNNNIEETYQDPVPLFERRPSRKSDVDDRRQSIDSQRQRRSIDKSTEEKFNSTEESVPLFASNIDQLSEDEDPFAELDRQYHVPVDHNFINDVSARTTPSHMQTSEVNQTNIKKEIDNQMQALSESPVKFCSGDQDIRVHKEVCIKQEVLQSPDFPKENSTPVNSENIAHRVDHLNVKQEYSSGYKETDKDTQKSEHSGISKTSQSNSRKRTTDQRPSHRKEKRKKSESLDIPKSSHSQGRSRSRARSKSQSTGKCNDAPKAYYSIFNSRDQSSRDSKDRKMDSTEKGYSDKYVKRKEPKRKDSKDDSCKKRSSSSSSIILSPKDSSHLNNSSVTPTKSDPKTKLKSIDMFVEQPKKVSVPHQAHRNTATTPIVAPKVVEEVKAKPVTPPTRKVVVQTKHVSTQVIKRVISKETQTFQSINVSTRYSQTEKAKLISKGSQTPHTFLEKKKEKSNDAFERMKEIDMEIQELLKEKFKLYHSLESKDQPCPSGTDLGMHVLNVNTIAENETEDVTDTMSPDNIVTEFTNIPVEELEEIALETVEDVNFEEAKGEKRSARRKALQQERLNSASPQSTSSRRSNKRAKALNISLLEQIITDDRPLEDIISLEELETPHPKQKKKPRSKPKKKVTKKAKSVKNPYEAYNLKECSVVLVRIDVSEFIAAQCLELKELPEEEEIFYTSVPSKQVPGEYSALPKHSPESFKQSSYHPKPQTSQMIEDSDVNDLQFDMLDVSEDIVIGESCEIKDKDNEQALTISEDLILDNSQSSADDAFSAESNQAENECKTYDYSTDEDLRRDSQTVTGNADAVLAIECIENDFLAACLDGNVYHFSGDGQLLNTMRGSNLAVTCLTIVKEKYGTTVYTGSLDSRIRYYDLETGLEKGPECNVLSPIQTMDRAWDTVFVGTRTGFVLQFECKNNMLIPVSTVKFSEQAILALRALKEGPRKVLLVASRSENVTIKDAQTGLLLRTLAGPKMTVYTLLFEDGKVYCGTSSHQIHVFDYASGSHTGCHEGGKGAVCLRATGGLLFAGCYDGCVYVYREGGTAPLAQLRGPGLMLLSLAVVGSKIIAGYKDRSLYIWKIPLSILQEMIL